jgi:hypothetical protein
MPVRARFLLIVPLAMTPLFAFTLRAAVEQSERAAARELTSIRRWVRLLASVHQRLVRDAQELLLLLARLPVVRGGDVDACRALFSELRAWYPRYATLGIAFPDGEVIASVNPLGAEARAWIRERILRRAVERGALTTGLPRLPGETRLPTVFLAKAVQRPVGTVILFASVEVAWVDRELASARLPEGATATVWD